MSKAAAPDPRCSRAATRVALRRRAACSSAPSLHATSAFDTSAHRIRPSTFATACLRSRACVVLYCHCPRLELSPRSVIRITALSPTWLILRCHSALTLQPSRLRDRVCPASRAIDRLIRSVSPRRAIALLRHPQKPAATAEFRARLITAIAACFLLCSFAALDLHVLSTACDITCCIRHTTRRAVRFSRLWSAAVCCQFNNTCFLFPFIPFTCDFLLFLVYSFLFSTNKIHFRFAVFSFFNFACFFCSHKTIVMSFLLFVINNHILKFKRTDFCFFSTCAIHRFACNLHKTIESFRCFIKLLCLHLVA